MNFKLIIDHTKDEEVIAIVHRPSSFTEDLEAWVREQCSDNQLPAYMEEDLFLLSYADIECILVIDGRTLAIDRKGRRLRLKQRLYELEQRLPDNFIRINKSALANLNRLERFAAGFSGSVDAIFKCGYREYVSRRCFAQIKRRLDNL